MENRISSQTVFNGRLIKVRVDEVSLADGRRSTREVVDHPGAVAIVAIDCNEQLALVRQYRYAVGRDLLEIPAGTLERGEEPRDTAARELREETGLQAARTTLLAQFYPSPGILSEQLWVYLAEDLQEASGDADDDEDIEVVRMTLEEAVAKIASGEIRDAKSIIGLLLARDHLYSGECH